MITMEMQIKLVAVLRSKGARAGRPGRAGRARRAGERGMRGHLLRLDIL